MADPRARRASFKDSCVHLVSEVYSTLSAPVFEGVLQHSSEVQNTTNDFNRSFPIGIDDHRVTLVRRFGAGGATITHGASYVYVRGYGLFVSYVQPRSAADIVKLRPGDEILSINEEAVSMLLESEQDISASINKPNRTTLLIRRPRLVKLKRPCSGMPWGFEETFRVVTSVQPNSPAHKAGVPVGYGIISINNQDVLGEDIEGMDTVVTLTSDRELMLGFRPVKVCNAILNGYQKESRKIRRLSAQQEKMASEMKSHWSSQDRRNVKEAQEESSLNLALTCEADNGEQYQSRNTQTFHLVSSSTKETSSLMNLVEESKEMVDSTDNSISARDNYSNYVGEKDIVGKKNCVDSAPLFIGIHNTGHETTKTFYGVDNHAKNLAETVLEEPAQQLDYSAAATFFVVELIWAAYYWWRSHVLCTQELSPPDFPDKSKFVEKIASATDYESYYSGWFYNVPYDKIKRENVVDLIGGNFYHKPRDSLTSDERKEILEFIVTGEKKGQLFYEGYNPDIRPLIPSLDPLVVWHQPLFVFLFGQALHSLAAFVLKQRGFTFEMLSVQGSIVRYWHKSAVCPPSSAETPIVFCHGIGVGLLPYLGLVSGLVKEYTNARDIILIDMPHVALIATEQVATMDIVSDAILDILRRHGSEKAAFVGHSYGTFVVARICKRFPEAIEGCIWLDPVCFCLYLPTTLYSFLYRTPERLMDWPRFAFISRNLYLNNVLKRNFWWYQHVLWDDELPSNMSVYLSKDDDIVPVQEVEDWLHKHYPHPDKVHTIPGTHASWLASPSRTSQILATIKSCLGDVQPSRMDNESVELEGVGADRYVKYSKVKSMGKRKDQPVLDIQNVRKINRRRTMEANN
eukprot:CFRG7180T1